MHIHRHAPMWSIHCLNRTCCFQACLYSYLACACYETSKTNKRSDTGLLAQYTDKSSLQLLRSSCHILCSEPQPKNLIRYSTLFLRPRLTSLCSKILSTSHSASSSMLTGTHRWRWCNPATVSVIALQQRNMEHTMNCHGHWQRKFASNLANAL